MLYYLKRILDYYWVKIVLHCIISLFLFIALGTYNSNDPSFNTATNSCPHNTFNYIGSYIADMLYQPLGISSFIFPIYYLIWAWKILKNKTLNHFLLKQLFLLISSFTLALILSIIGVTFHINLHSVIGSLFSSILIKKFGSLFSVIILSFLFTIFLSISLEVNLLKLINLLMSYKKYFSKVTLKKQQALKKSLKISNQVSKKELLSNSKKLNIKDPVTSSISLPLTNLLEPKYPEESNVINSTILLRQNSERLLNILEDFGVRGKVIKINQGPVVTTYEFEPDAGIKSSRIIGLSGDIARSLSVTSSRVALIKGKSALGVELPNETRKFFCLRELIESVEYKDSNLLLPIALGKDLIGRTFITDLIKMPHLLIAGTTGSGKSMIINAIIMSLLFKQKPQECRLIMIDPKVLELSIYNGIPHLLTPVINDYDKAFEILQWAIKEMEKRYDIMSNIGVRNIVSYNEKIIESLKSGKVLEHKVQVGFDKFKGNPIYESIPLSTSKLPFIIIIIDEIADLILFSKKETELLIQKLSQMARAAGIHIIIATQRPSVDIITGNIKANFPSRISFKVASKIDSRIILGEQGAEQLLGMGDMLYLGYDSNVTRIHGPLVKDDEIKRVINYFKSI